MPTINGNGKKMIKGLFWVPVFMVGVSVATYTLVIPEPAKLLLLGAFLIGLAFWGKKHMAEREAPVSTELRVLSTEQYGPQTTGRLQSAERTAQSVEQNQEPASSMRLAAKR